MRNGLPFEILVEVIAAHDSQSLDGTPESRVEERVEQSIALARSAALTDLRLYLDRQDLAWLCAARRVDRYSEAARHLNVGGLNVSRAKVGFESHLLGLAATGIERPFPIIADPSLTPGFIQYVPTEMEKAALLEKFQAYVLQEAIGAPASGKWN